MIGNVSKALGGLENLLASKNITNDASSNKEDPSLISRLISSAPLALSAYYTYDAAKGMMDYMNSPSNSNTPSKNITNDTSDESSWYQDAALGGLKLIVGGLLAAGAYNRVRAAEEYYRGEVHNFDMQEEHLSGLAYALTFAKQPPQYFDMSEQGKVYNTVYKTLKVLRVDRLDNTKLGSDLMLGVLGMGRQVVDETSGIQKEMAQKILSKKNKKAS